MDTTMSPEPSIRPPVFPPELWLLIVEHLQDEDSPQHISRLAQTSRWFYQAFNHLIYQPVRLERRANAQKFAELLCDKPEVKEFITEIRHCGDMGFQNFSYFCSTFYRQLATLDNLQTLIMRPKWRKRDPRWRHVWESLLYDAYLNGAHTDWSQPVEGCLTALMAAEDHGDIDVEEEFPGDWNPLDDDHPQDYILPCHHSDLLAMTSFCGNSLRDSLPALRTCHIGTYSLQKWKDRLTIFFNCSLFYLPQLETLCITGADFETVGDMRAASSALTNIWHTRPVSGSMTNLEELKLLNCRISESDLGRILSYPAALKRLTLRGPNCFDEDMPEQDSYHLVASALAQHQGASLISLDLDIYRGSKPGMILTGLHSLTKLTVTQNTILGVELPSNREFGDVLPSSVETLTLRYENEMMHLPLSNLYATIMSDKIPHLTTVILLIPDNPLDPLSTHGKYSEAQSYLKKFKEIGVQLELSLTDYPLKMIRSSICPCEHLQVYHQFPFHPKIPSDAELEELEGDTDSEDSEDDQDRSDSDEDDEGDGDGDRSGHSSSEDSDNPDDRDDSSEHDSAQNTPVQDNRVNVISTETSSAEANPVEEDSTEDSPIEKTSVDNAPEQEIPNEHNSDYQTAASNGSMYDDRVEDSDHGYESDRDMENPSPRYLRDLAPRALLHFHPDCSFRDEWINGYGYL